MAASDSPPDERARPGFGLSPWVIDLFLRGVIPLIGVTALVAGLMGVMNHAVLPVVDVFRSRNWVPTPATVETAAVRPAALALEPAPLELLEVRYRYVFDGQTYVGEAYGPHHGVDEGEVHEATLRGLEATPAITVWVNPASPQEAVISRALSWPVMALALPALALTAIGILLVFAGMVAWNNWRSWRCPVQD